MGKKKNKKYNDYDDDDQMLALKKINAVIYGNAPLSSVTKKGTDDGEDDEEVYSYDPYEEIGEALARRKLRKDEPDNSHLDQPYVKAVQTPLAKQPKRSYMDKRENNNHSPKNAPVSKATTTNETHSEMNASLGISINRLKNELVDILRISDGIRSIDIDIKMLSINGNDYELTNGYSFVDCASIRLAEIIDNFYPSAILMKDEDLDSFRRVDGYDDDKFVFYDYPDNDMVVFAYCIDTNSIDTWYDVVDELTKSNYIVDFLRVVKEQTGNTGFTFTNVSNAHLEKLMSSDIYNRGKEDFIAMFLEDKETETSKDTYNDDLKQAIDIYPFEYEDEAVSIMLGEIEYNPDTDDDNDDEDDDEDDDNEPEEVEPKEATTSTVTTIKTTQVVTTEVQTPDIVVDEVSGDSLFGDTGDADDDNLEEQYFGRKNQPRASMKSYNSKSSSDDSFVVKRR